MAQDTTTSMKEGRVEEGTVSIGGRPKTLSEGVGVCLFVCLLTETSDNFGYFQLSLHTRCEILE